MRSFFGALVAALKAAHELGHKTSRVTMVGALRRYIEKA